MQGVATEIKRRGEPPCPVGGAVVPKNEMNLRCSFVLSLSVCLLAPSAVMEIHGKMRQLETQLFGWRTRQGSPREEETQREMAERENLRIATHKVVYEHLGSLKLGVYRSNQHTNDSENRTNRSLLIVVHM